MRTVTVGPCVRFDACRRWITLRGTIGSKQDVTTRQPLFDAGRSGSPQMRIPIPTAYHKADQHRGTFLCPLFSSCRSTTLVYACSFVLLLQMPSLSQKRACCHVRSWHGIHLDMYMRIAAVLRYRTSTSLCEPKRVSKPRGVLMYCTMKSSASGLADGNERCAGRLSKMWTSAGHCEVALNCVQWQSGKVQRRNC